MRTITLVSVLTAAVSTSQLPAQQIDVTFPSDHVSIAGATNERRIPFGSGARRSMILYEAVDLGVPNGQAITHVGFRRDEAVISLGPTVDFEIFMGQTTVDTATMSAMFAANYTNGSTQVFTRKVVRLPDLGNPLRPNPTAPNIWFQLDTPFVFDASLNLIVDYHVHVSPVQDYTLDEATGLSVTSNNGQGCTTSTNRVPSLTANALVVPGTWRLQFTNGTPNSIGAVLVSFRGLAGSTILHAIGAPGCDLYINLNPSFGVSALTNGGGSFTQSFPFGDDPSWNDVRLFGQVLLLDPTANALGIVTSNGVETELGMRPRMASVQGNLTGQSGGAASSTRNVVSLFRY